MWNKTTITMTKYVFITSLLLIVVGATIKILLNGGEGATVILLLGLLGLLASFVLFIREKMKE